MFNLKPRLSKNAASFIVISLTFVVILSTVANSPWMPQFYLINYQNIKRVNCSEPNARWKYKICGRSYPTFPAFVDIDAGKFGNCGIDFSYKTGKAMTSSNAQQKSVGEIWRNECQDKVVRSFVKVNQTSETFQKRCSTCALVFPSGRLLGKGSGADIDGKECVIRLNNSPTRGFELDVGGRTTIIIMAHNALTATVHPPLTVIDSQADCDILVWDPPNSGKAGEGGMMVDIDTLELSKTLQTLRPHTSVFYGSTNYYDALWSMLVGSTPNQANNTFWISTGFYSVAIALNICDNLTIYGMIGEDICLNRKTFAPYHYYSDPRVQGDCDQFDKHNKKATNKHKFDQEREVLKEITKHRSLSVIYL